MENDKQNPYSTPEADVSVTPGPDEQVLAGLGARLGGAIIDGILQTIVVIPVIMLFFGSGVFTNPEAANALGITYFVFSLVISIAVYALLHGYLLSKSGQTIGKKLVGTQIVSAQDGAPTTLGKVIGLRVLPVYFVSVIPLIGVILALINVLLIFRADRRCGHDMIAGTRVIRYRSG